ncbi:MAG: 4'-phosphopantetheinyl transferase superfamily protein [Marinilabilia sp.]
MPLIFEATPDKGHGRLAVWKISENEPDLLQMLPPLEDSEVKLLSNISYQPRRLEWLASRVLIYRLTGLYPGTCYNHRGQPFITNCHDNLSISHTRGYAAVSLSPDSPPGIDIERPSQRIEKVAGRFLNASEKNFITDIEKEEQLGLIWCAKEAVFKKAGQPGVIFKDHIIISPFTSMPDGKLSATLIGDGKETTIHLGYHNTPEYYLVWTL